jgi:hypothetical protein
LAKAIAQVRPFVADDFEAIRPGMEVPRREAHVAPERYAKVTHLR